MQIQNFEKFFEQERKSFKLRVSELEKKVEEVTHNLSVAESTLALKETELSNLHVNLNELEELREMKEVIVMNQYFIFLFYFATDVLYYIIVWHTQVLESHFSLLKLILKF